MSEEKKGELSSNPPTGSTFHPPNNRNNKLPFIRRRGEMAHISIGRRIR
jgi:hypothetical protein